MAAQAGDKGLRLPVPERSGPRQTRAAPAAAAQARQLGGDGGFVHKHEPVRLIAHLRLASRDPGVAGGADVGPIALRRHQGFFYT